MKDRYVAAIAIVAAVAGLAVYLVKGSLRRSLISRNVIRHTGDTLKRGGPTPPRLPPPQSCARLRCQYRKMLDELGEQLSFRLVGREVPDQRARARTR